jgi:hypothetical protein
MLAIGWVIAAIVVAILLTTWVICTATRLDRLHARVDAAQASLDAQLVRRAAAVRHLLEAGSAGLSGPEQQRFGHASQTALNATGDDRQAAENELGHVIGELAERSGPGWPDAADATELHEAGVRVIIARRFYNDAVRDTRELRSRLMPRILRMAGHREMPQFFDIDDTFTYPDPPAPSTTPSEPPNPPPHSSTEEFTS